MKPTTRREFLDLSTRAFTAGVFFPGLSPRSLWRAAERTGKGDNVLVIVELSGGNDGLNTVVPFADDAYHKARPALAIKPDRVVKLDDRFGLHPDLALLKDLWDRGQVAIVHGVGYPQPNRSHFTSMDIWHTADPREGPRRTGWLGRFLDERARTDASAAAVGLAVGGELPLAMCSEHLAVPSISGLDGLTLRTDPRSGQDSALEVETIRQLARLPRPGEAETLTFLRQAMAGACEEGDRLRRVAASYKAAAQYEGALGNKLGLVARMVDGEFPTRVFYAATGGYDTHAGQEYGHGVLHRGFARAVTDFFKDLAAHGHADRVTLMAFSEFGRRVVENGSRGTDHGTAGPVIVVGGGVRGGLLGEHPSLTDLDQGDLKFGVDFRRVYATLLESWMGAKAAPILGDAFTPLPLFRGREV